MISCWIHHQTEKSLKVNLQAVFVKGTLSSPGSRYGICNQGKTVTAGTRRIFHSTASGCHQANRKFVRLPALSVPGTIVLQRGELNRTCSSSPLRSLQDSLSPPCDSLIIECSQRKREIGNSYLLPSLHADRQTSLCPYQMLVFYHRLSPWREWKDRITSQQFEP